MYVIIVFIWQSTQLLYVVKQSCNMLLRLLLISRSVQCNIIGVMILVRFSQSFTILRHKENHYSVLIRVQTVNMRYMNVNRTIETAGENESLVFYEVTILNKPYMRKKDKQNWFLSGNGYLKKTKRNKSETHYINKHLQPPL